MHFTADRRPLRLNDVTCPYSGSFVPDAINLLPLAARSLKSDQESDSIYQSKTSSHVVRLAHYGV